MDIAEALRVEGVTPLDARVLLRSVLRADDAHILAHPGQPLTPEQLAGYLALVQRRRTGEPVAYLIGAREFYSLPFKVTPAVLVPRPETELLVELALERMAVDAPARVLDLGTGSGCVAVAIAHERPQAQVVAVDRSAAAVALARENAHRLAPRNVTVLQGEWFEPLSAARFDVIVANPPYVAAGDPHLAADELRFEPRDALVAGATGYECIAAIVAQARRHLEPGGWLLLEHGHDQAARCRELLAGAGCQNVFSARDLARIERVSGGRFDSGGPHRLK